MRDHASMSSTGVCGDVVGAPSRSRKNVCKSKIGKVCKKRWTRGTSSNRQPLTFAIDTAGGNCCRACRFREGKKKGDGAERN